MVTNFNPKDLVEFGNFCLELLDKGMIEEQHGVPEITKQHFENWKLSKDISKKELGAQKTFIDFLNNVKDHNELAGNSSLGTKLVCTISTIHNGRIEKINFSNKDLGASGFMSLSFDQSRILDFEGFFEATKQV